MNNLPEKLQKIVKEVDQQIAPKLAEIEDQIVYNTAKVLAAYQANDVAEADLGQNAVHKVSIAERLPKV